MNAPDNHGIAKRLLGNARAIVAGVFVATAALAGAAQEAIPFATRILPDVIEVSGSQAYTSQSFSQWGWRTVEPVDLVSDFSDHRNRERLTKLIRETSPRLVVMNDCHPRTHGVSTRSYLSRSQAERRECKKSERCHEIFQFTMMCVKISCEGRAKVFSEKMCKQPRIQCVVGRHPTRHRCKWATTCDRIADEIGQVAIPEVLHSPDCSADTCRREIAKAIRRGYVRYLRDVNPGRVRRMLRSVSARIRRKVHNGDSGVQELRWNEKNVAGALKQWMAVYAQGDEMDDEDERESIPDLEEPNDGQSDQHMDDQARDSEAPNQTVRESWYQFRGACRKAPQ